MFLQEVQDLFTQVKSIQIDPGLIEIPQERSMGDFALPCFLFAKELKKAPQAIAQEIAEQLTPTWRIAKIEAVWPYVNVTLNSGVVVDTVVQEVLTQGSDFAKWEQKNKKILVEGRSPNTHKMLHVWHLRNALVSETMCSISEYAGYEVVRSAYGGDIWAHVAKWIWYVKKFTDGDYPTDAEAFGIWSGDMYAQATAKVDEKPEIYKQEIHEVQRLLESGDADLNTFRQETRALSIAWLKAAFEELWCTIQKFYRESDVEQPGIELVKTFLEDENIPDIRMSEWAIIADLEAYDLGVFLLLKSNGTSLYSTKDVALAYLKESDYEFDTSLYVVATEQNHHFKQLFKTLELAWYDTSKLHHMWYELVELPDGKMSSRKWTIIPYHTRRDSAIQQAKDLMKERTIQDDDTLARSVAFAALKFSMLLQDTYKKIRLDMNTALSFEWETWPYLQYTHARCASVLRKWERNGSIEKTAHVTYTDKERLLCYHMSELSDTIQKAAQEYKPSLIARYVLELARQFNAYYQTTKILVEDDEVTTQARLALVASVQQVLKTGLWLLWIEAPETM